MSASIRSFIIAAVLSSTGVLAQELSVEPDGSLFVEQPGVMEFSGQMIVRPRQDLFGSTNPAPNASPARPVRNFRVQQATDRARARLLPQAVEFFGEVDEYIVTVPAGMTENTYAAQLLSTGDYEYVEPNWTVFLVDTVPNDPNFSSSWQHTNIQSAKAWDIVTGDATSIVAIVDTGIDLDHPDLQGLIISGFNAVSDLAQADGGDVNDSHGHGTFCSGCAAAHGDNNTQVVGVGWNFQIMPIRVNSGSAGSASQGNLNQGARWAADNGATVANVSWSGVESRGVQITAEYCRRQGCLYFRAAGNDDRNLVGFEHEDAVVVGASTSSDNRAGFSNYGTPIDIFAPGSGVRATVLGGGQGTGSGTSFAAPIAAGVAALIHSVNPDLRPRDLRDILYASSDDLGATGEDDVFGFGRVNSFQAVQLASTYCPKVYIENEPSEMVVCERETLHIEFEVDAINPTYQWLLDGSDLAGQAGPTLTINDVSELDEGMYSLEITTDCRVEVSAGTLVTVTELVSIVEQPSSLLLEPGQDAVFTVVAGGDVKEYLWFRNEIAQAGEIFDTLTIASVTEDDAGAYSCWAIGFCGELVDSADAILTVGIDIDCPPDVNHDGQVTAADFTAWIAAFNAEAPECDQNGDGSCTAADFTAWIANFNAGC